MRKTLKLAGFSVSAILWALTVASPVLGQSAAGSTKLGGQVSVSEGFDSVRAPASQSLVPQNASQSGGPSTTFSASTEYARPRRSLQLSGSASAYFTYNQRLSRVAAESHDAHLGAGIRLPKRATLQITQSAAYSGSYLYQLLPTAILPPEDPILVNPEYLLDQTGFYSYNTGTEFAFGSPRATRVTATAQYTISNFENQVDARPNLGTYAAGATVSRGLSRSLTISAGYAYEVGDFGFGTPAQLHAVTLGVEYSPALSPIRRLTFRLDVSPSVLETPESTLTTGVATPRQYPWQGAASVEYPFRPKWRTGVSYRRSVEYMAGLGAPVLTTGALATLNGVLGPRINVSAFVGYVTTASSISSSTDNLDTYSGTVRVSYAVTRALSLYSDYFSSYYNLGDQGFLAAGLHGVHEQRGIRVGFTLAGQPLGR